VEIFWITEQNSTKHSPSFLEVVGSLKFENGCF